MIKLAHYSVVTVAAPVTTRLEASRARSGASLSSPERSRATLDDYFLEKDEEGKVPMKINRTERYPTHLFAKIWQELERKIIDCEDQVTR